MKKLAILLTVIIVVTVTTLGFTACGGGSEFREPLVPQAPWGIADNIFEQSDFRVHVYGPGSLNPDSETHAPLLARGALTQTLEGVGSGIHNRITVQTEFSMDWESEVENPSINAGAHDEISSSVTFMRTGMRPVASSRVATTTNRYDASGTFLHNNSYEFNVQYVAENQVARGSSIRVGKDANGAWLNDARNVAVRSGTLFCNEQLFFLLRAFNNINPGGRSVNIPTNNMVENYIRHDNRPISLNAEATATGRLAVDDFILEFMDEENAYMDDESGNVMVDSMMVTLALNETPAGPIHRFWISNGVTFSREGSLVTTSRLILRYEYQVFDIYGRLQYQIVYTLIGYDSW